MKYYKRRDTRLGDKVKARYTGPYVIADSLGKGCYKLGQGNKIFRKVVNRKLLKPYIENADEDEPLPLPKKRRKVLSGVSEGLWVPELNLTQQTTMLFPEVCY